jgi:methylglutaconyl-CoA hydratase
MNAFETLATLTFSQHGAVATLTLNRPDVRNAFNETVIAELTGAFHALAKEDSVRAIVLAADGPAFCAGADLNWMKKMAGYSDDENRADALRLAEMLRAIYACPKPVIARVQGDTYAGGVGLVAACDIVVAVDSANFCLSEAKLGLIPATISPYVIRALGEQASRRYFITAERFSAAEAHRLGLVHALVGADALDAKVGEITAALVANSPNAVRESKRLVREVAGASIDDALLADTANRIAAIRASEEGREGELAAACLSPIPIVLFEGSPHATHPAQFRCQRRQGAAHARSGPRRTLEPRSHRSAVCVAVQRSAVPGAAGAPRQLRCQCRAALDAAVDQDRRLPGGLLVLPAVGAL